MRIGSLCSGYGGLEMAVREVFGGELAWWSDVAPGAVRTMEHREPGAPNLGDVKAVDWSSVEPVDLVAAGYPCQPFSNAGKRRGIDDERHLWPYVAGALRVLRPRLVVLENVAAHLRRGFHAVLGDLAALGYDAAWTTLRACDIGAPHRRDRVFVFAVDPDRPAADARCGGLREHAGFERRPDATDGREPPVADADGQRFKGPQPEGRPDLPPGSDIALDWREFEPAVRRWESVLGRPAPAPSVLGPRGGVKVSPRFGEWLMGLPDGWVSGVPGLTINEQLKLIGNGVVPLQAATALRYLAGILDVPTLGGLA